MGLGRRTIVLVLESNPGASSGSEERFKMTPLERQAVTIGRWSAEKKIELHDLSAWFKARGKPVNWSWASVLVGLRSKSRKQRSKT